MRRLYFVLILFLFSVLCFTPSKKTLCANIESQQKAEISLETRAYKQDKGRKTKDQNLGGLIHPELILRKDDDLRTQFEFYYRFDSVDEDRELFNLQNLWIEKSFQETKKTFSFFRLGYQIFNFSVLEVFHPNDVLNSYNYDTPNNNKEKLGELALLYSHKIPYGILEFYLLPLDKKSHYAGKRSPLGFKKEVISNDWHGNQVQWGASFKTLISSADINFYLFHSRDRKTPLLEFKPAQDSLVAHHFSSWHGGATYEQEWGDRFMLKSELSFAHFEDNKTSYLTLMGMRKRSSYETFSLGLDKTHGFENSGGEIKCFAEYQVYFGLKRETHSELDLFPHNMALGFIYSPNDVNAQEWKASFITGLERKGDYIVDLSYGRQFKEVWRGSLSGKSVFLSKVYPKNDSYHLIEAKISRYF